MAESLKTTRRPRFSYDELDALADAVEQRRTVLFHKCTDVITRKAKNEAWKCVTHAVNAVSKVERDVPEVRRKWKDWQSVVKIKRLNKKKLEQQMKTAGGSKTLTHPEEKILSFIDTGTTKSTGVDANHAINHNSDSSSEGKHRPTNVYATPDMPAVTSKQNATHDYENVHSESEDEIGMYIPVCEITKEGEGGDFQSNKNNRLEETIRQQEPRSVHSNSNEEWNMSHQLLRVEKDRLEIEAQRLQIEKQRLAIETEKLDLLRQIVLRHSSSSSSSDPISEGVVLNNM